MAPYEVNLSPVFAVDLETETVMLEDGSRWLVDTWYDPIAQECTPERAAACIFQGPFNLWFVVDLKALHLPDVIN